MKKILSILFLFPCVAFAAIPIPDGSVQQESCAFSSYDLRHQIWQYEPSAKTIFTVKNKISAAGKNISTGDTLFYASSNTTTSEYYYSPQSNDIALRSHSFITLVEVVSTGGIFRRAGALTSPDGKIKYTLLTVPAKTWGSSFQVAVDENGFICSGRIANFTGEDGKAVFDIAEYDVFQKAPLVKHEMTKIISDDTIALTLVHMDDIFATVNVKYIKGGQVLKQKDIQFDMMSGTLQVEGLRVSFSKKNHSSLKIESIDDPKDYRTWFNDVNTRLLGAR